MERWEGAGISRRLQTLSRLPGELYPLRSLWCPGRSLALAAFPPSEVDTRGGLQAVVASPRGRGRGRARRHVPQLSSPQGLPESVPIRAPVRMRFSGVLDPAWQVRLCGRVKSPFRLKVPRLRETFTVAFFAAASAASWSCACLVHLPLSSALKPPAC